MNSGKTVVTRIGLVAQNMPLPTYEGRQGKANFPLSWRRSWVR